MKRCARCKVEKPRSEFLKDKRPDRDLAPYCKKCRKDRIREYRREHRDILNLRDRTRYAERRWARHLRAKYGITPEQYDALLVKQDGKCAICRGDEPGGKEGCKRFHVDHDHQTGEVRGLLCSKCNQMLGYASDSPETLRAAACYLENPICAETAKEFIKAYREARGLD